MSDQSTRTVTSSSQSEIGEQASFRLGQHEHSLNADRAEGYQAQIRSSSSGIKKQREPVRRRSPKMSDPAGVGRRRTRPRFMPGPSSFDDVYEEMRKADAQRQLEQAQRQHQVLQQQGELFWPPLQLLQQQSLPQQFQEDQQQGELFWPPQQVPQQFEENQQQGELFWPPQQYRQPPYQFYAHQGYHSHLNTPLAREYDSINTLDSTYTTASLPLVGYMMSPDNTVGQQVWFTGIMSAETVPSYTGNIVSTAYSNGPKANVGYSGGIDTGPVWSNNDFQAGFLPTSENGSFALHSDLPNGLEPSSQGFPLGDLSVEEDQNQSDLDRFLDRLAAEEQQYPRDFNPLPSRL